MATSSEFSTRIQTFKYNIEVIENSSSIPNNSSSVTVTVRAWSTFKTHTYAGTCYCNINGTSYNQSKTSTSIGASPVVIFSTSVTIPHNADGSKSIYVEARLFDNGFNDYISNFNGFTVTLSNIPRQANITGAENFTDEGSPKITYNNVAGNSVTSLQACITNASGTVLVAYRNIAKTGTSYTFNLTSAERTALRNATPNSNSMDVLFKVKTVIYGSTFESSKQAQMSIVNANPTLSGATYKDTNASIVAITTDNQKIVQNKSNLQINFASITALKGATLTAVDVTINSVTKSVALSGTSKTNVVLNWGTVNTSSDIFASVTVRDSRGNTQLTFMTISVYDYHIPWNICTAKRLSNFYDTTIIKADVRISELGGHNSVTITWAYRLKGASSWTEMGTIENQSSTSIVFDNTQSYEVRFSATDRLENSTIIRNVPVGIPLLFFDTVNQSIGLRCMPQRQLCSGVPLSMQSENNNVTLNIRQNALDFFKDEANGAMTAQISGGTNGQLLLFAREETQTPIVLNGDTGKIVCYEVIQISSRDVKENIKEMTLEEALKILELTAVSFDYKTPHSTDHRGFIAEDVAEIIPEIVSEPTEHAPVALNYNEMIPYLQTVIKAQEERISALEDRLAELEKKLENNK